MLTITNGKERTSNMSERTLATIQKIVDIKPIERADKIELAFVKSWQVVVAKKDNFKVGDLVVYVEINAQLNEKLIKMIGLWDETKNIGRLGGNAGNRVKTRKFRGVLSQGLIINTNILNNFAK